MLKEKVLATPSCSGGHCLGWPAQFSFELPKPLVPAVARIDVENENIPFPTWSEPNVCVWPFCPPDLYLIAICGRVVDAVGRAWMLAWTCTINTSARTTSLYDCVQRDNRQTESGIFKGLRFLGNLFFFTTFSPLNTDKLKLAH
jgi:hypothetical protein